MRTTHFAAMLLAFTTLAPSPARADDRPDSHAPIGVMADHTHEAGEVMFSYRFMHMDMGGTRIDDDPIAPDTIVTTVPNRFFGRPGQPPTLRVVPLEMRMDMHMAGVMYAPTDWVTLMAMGSYVTKEMPHRTYRGGMGTDVLGGFTTRPEGFGDTMLAALFPVIKRHDETSAFEVNLRAGVSLPTGSTTKTDEVLTPMNMRVTQRLPYPMQLGSGTLDLLPGVTVKGHEGRLGFGVQYQGTVRTGTNDQGYRLGDTHMATAWGSVLAAPWLSLSARVSGRTTDDVRGIDPAIVAPVQTADPANQGGERLDLFVGANTIATGGPLKGYRLGVEAGAPVYQHLNGPQLEENWQLTVGLQKAF